MAKYSICTHHFFQGIAVVPLFPWAIIDGDRVTGVTFHYIDKGIDTGKIILQVAVSTL